MTEDRQTIGRAGAEAGLSPRMLRYLEQQGVLTSEREPHRPARRGPAPRGGPAGVPHRHFPPHEVRLARAAAQALERGEGTGTLRALRRLAAARVADARTRDDPVAWFELLALAAEVDVAARAGEPPPPPPPPGPDEPEGSREAG